MQARDGAAARTAASLTDGDITVLLERAPLLSGVPFSHQRVPGGLTNVNVRITAAGVDAVARISTQDSSLLAIDRAAEEANSRAAAASGAAPAVLGYDEAAQVLFVQWVHGRTFGPADVKDERQWPRLAQVCRTLHAGPRFVTDFDMFAVQRRYLDVCTGRGFRLPDGYLDHQEAFERVRAALAVRPVRTVPCHNDLLAENVVDDGQRLWLIDYEYAGNNDPWFEIGNLWSESDLPVEALPELVRCYAGAPHRHLVARARLLALASKYGWTLWAAIQSAASSVDFDFWSWGLEKYDRAVAEFGSAAFPRVLEEAIADPV